MRPPLTRLAKRRPRGRNLAWARLPHSRGPGAQADAVEWRIFRRDLRNVSHMERAVLSAATSRVDAALHVRAARAQLRWRVDRLDFAHLGLTDTTPQPELTA